MAAAHTGTGGRLGRPPASDSSDTRQRILDTARASFAVGGYIAGTNRDLAAEVGITAGALYHYFGSKLDLYLAVHDDVHERIQTAFALAAASRTGFVGRFEAVLDAAHELNREDPSLAAFIGATRADMRRHPEIEAAIRPSSRSRTAFFDDLVDDGVARGEIPAEHRELLIQFVRTVLIGLADGMSDDTERHRRAVTSIKLLLRGELLSPTARRPAAGAAMPPAD